MTDIDTEDYDDYEYWRKFLDDDDDGGDDDERPEETFRAEARFWAEEANQDFGRYRAALKNDEEEMANLYYDEAMLCRKYVKESNEAAAEIAFARNNEYRTLDIIDLHNLFVVEAITKLADRINAAKVWTDLQQLTVIVGRGHHSEYGPKLKTAVANFAVKNNFPYWFDSLNPGRMVLHLEDASEIRSPDNECEHLSDSDASIYIYNRASEVPLSEFITQTQRSKNRKKAKQRAFDRQTKVPSIVKDNRNSDDNSCRSNKIPSSLTMYKNQQRDSNHISQKQSKCQRSRNKKKEKRRATDRTNEVPCNVKGSQNGEQTNEKCNVRSVDDSSNHMSSLHNNLQIQQNYSTHILQDHPSTFLVYESRDRPNEFGTLFLYIFLVIIIGAVFIQSFLPK